MSATVFFLIAGPIWSAIGLTAAVLMARRGHHLASWAVLGVVFGPLILPLAFDAARREPTAEPERLLAGEADEGPVDVLVGIDRSPEAAAALRSTVELLGPRLGRLSLATVVDYDAGAAEEKWEIDESKAFLLRTAETVSEHHPEAAILVGRPAEVLVKYANEGGYDMLVIGTRGHGASKALLGSVASCLAADATVPVLMVSR